MKNIQKTPQSNREGNSGPDWRDEAINTGGGSPSLRRIACVSVLTIVLGFGGLTGWASIAQIDSAVGAPGVFVSAGKRKTLSMLDPGLLRTVNVHEGDHVQAGQVLLRLDDVQATAAREQARIKLLGATARVARLSAEAADLHLLKFADDLKAIAASDRTVFLLLEAERQLFASRWSAYEQHLKVAMQRLTQASTQIPVIEAQIRSLTTRLSLSTTEQANVDALLRQGYQTRQHMVELHLMVADLTGQTEQARGQLIGAKSAVEQARLELSTDVSSRHADIAKDLQEAELARVDAVQVDRGSADMLARRELIATEPGIVTDMKLFTIGSAVGAGQPILDLVPLDSELLIEASVAPIDIEHLSIGQRVNVRLTAYKSHKVPVITGKLVYVAADRTLDAQSQPVFLARVSLDANALAGLEKVAVYAGMPADVLIIGGERSVLDFLLTPIRENLQHAMHEE